MLSASVNDLSLRGRLYDFQSINVDVMLSEAVIWVQCTGKYTTGHLTGFAHTEAEQLAIGITTQKYPTHMIGLI